MINGLLQGWAENGGLDLGPDHRFLADVHGGQFGQFAEFGQFIDLLTCIKPMLTSFEIGLIF